MSEQLPVVCCLSDEELRKREATLLTQFKAALTASEELDNGYVFRLPGDGKWLVLIADLMVAERDCCPFLKFELTAEPKMGPLLLSITGPDGTKEFLTSLLG